MLRRNSNLHHESSAFSIPSQIIDFAGAPLAQILNRLLTLKLFLNMHTVPVGSNAHRTLAGGIEQENLMRG
jgi:hypothetical protein